MENYKALQAHQYFTSGWVQNVLHNILPSGNVLLMCDVRPSYRTSDKPHKPWVGLSKSGYVIAAHCDCMAGLGETCSHVAATLYKVEAAVRHGLTSQTCTDIPCQWNQTFQSSVQPSPIADIQFYSEASKNKISAGSKRKKEVTVQGNIHNLLKLIDEKGAKTVGLSLFAKYQKLMRLSPA